MIRPEDLSLKDLKAFHKATREKIECAIIPPPSMSNVYAFMNPTYNPIKAEGLVVLMMIDEEFVRRGYDPEKLFKNYSFQKLKSND